MPAFASAELARRSTYSVFRAPPVGSDQIKGEEEPFRAAFASARTSNPLEATTTMVTQPAMLATSPSILPYSRQAHFSHPPCRVLAPCSTMRAVQGRDDAAQRAIRG